MPFAGYAIDGATRLIVGLRLEQKLPWDDIARVLGHGPDELARASAVLRKRYQRLKERLRELVAASTAEQ